MIPTGNEVRGVGAEGTVPDPALVALEYLLKLELPVTPYGPDLHRRICRAGGKISVDMSNRVNRDKFIKDYVD